MAEDNRESLSDLFSTDSEGANDQDLPESDVENSSSSLVESNVPRWCYAEGIAERPISRRGRRSSDGELSDSSLPDKVDSKEVLSLLHSIIKNVKENTKCLKQIRDAGQSTRYEITCLIVYECG